MEFPLRLIIYSTKSLVDLLQRRLQPQQFWRYGLPPP
jgi:hypothetical protein